MSISNLIFETSQTTGTGNITVAARDGWRRFSNGFSTGGSNVFFYFIRHRTESEWEVGTGHLSDTNTLVRDTVIASSNSNALVDFSAGDKDIVNDIPASQQVLRDAEIVSITGDAGITKADHNGKILHVTANAVLTIPDDLPAGFQCIVSAASTGLTITIRTDPADSSTLNGTTDGSFNLIESVNSIAYLYATAPGTYFMKGNDFVVTP